MRRAKFLLAYLLLPTVFVPATLAQNVKSGGATVTNQTVKPINIPIKEFKLKNGLRVILSEDHSAPTYSISVTYNVGSRNEKPGRTGFAHLFEHMMFQGSENVGKGEHFILVLNNGGNMNGTTNADRTNYFQSMPINQLDLGLFLEADRMKSLVINQANLDNQRNAVQEERRLGVDNQAYGKTFETIFDTAYDNFAYKHSTIGSMADLNAATVEDVAAFFKMYYAPNNATLVLVGDFKADEALAKIKKYFEAIPSQPAPPALDTTEPQQTAERRKTIEDAFARSTRLDIVYKIPQSNTPDWYALSVLGQILGSGQSSRLYQQLVKEKQMVVQVFASAQERRGPSLGSVVALLPPTPNADPAAVEKAIYAEIERLKTEPVADWELEKVRMQIRRQRAQQLRSTLFRSILLGQYAVYYDDPSLINQLDAKYAAVTKEDIMRVAKKYLVDTNRTVVTTVPAKKSGPTAGMKPAE
ncbi:MAG: insulinase family protein [Pyrinomonadaceae bacterium]|nr:insulinase family protein [Pyrinomonadaceae bacterium]